MSYNPMDTLVQHPFDAAEKARLQRWQEQTGADARDLSSYAVIRMYSSGICEDRQWTCWDDEDVVRTVAYYRLPHEKVVVYYNVRRSPKILEKWYSEAVTVCKAGEPLPAEWFEGVAA
jgi:hypothetical protein